LPVKQHAAGATERMSARIGKRKRWSMIGEARRFREHTTNGTPRIVRLDKRTPVVLDEPEGHLHPPLFSAFVRAIADLLVTRNGVTLISTHSPVVLQEVPSSCVWMLRRTHTWSMVERPSLETFGESAGVLTREVFGLEVTNSGFHQLVSAVAQQPGITYEAVEAHFNQQLGAEARALARSLVTQPRG
jgi:hypothetical protein